MTAETLREALPGREWVPMPGAEFFREGVDIYVNQQLVTGFYDNRLIYIEAYGFEKERGDLVLASQGHLIVDVAYTLASRADLFGMVGDVKRALCWLKAGGGS